MLSRIAALLCCLMMFTGVCSAETGEAGDSSRIMVLPFDGTSSGKFSYLTDSVRSMVSSRLAAKQGVALVDYAVNAEQLRLLNSGKASLADGESLFSKFQTDYFVSGVLNELQTGLKIQVMIVSKIEGSDSVQLSVLAGNEERILPALQELIDDIAAEALGVKAAEAGIAQGGGTGDGLSGFTTEHPEKLYKKGVYSGAIVVEGEGVPAARSVGVRRSSVLPTMLVSMDIADLDGDGLHEIVSASRTALEVYQFNETRFKKIGEYKFSKDFKVNAVNVADINGDGKPEIYISANRGDRAASAIFSWREAEGLKQLAGDIGWYLRPIEKPGSGVVLAGQRGSKDPLEGFVRGGVYELSVYPDLSGVRQESQLPLPKNVRLFDFEWVDLDNDNRFELVAVDQREKLLVYDSQNSLAWVSDEEYGGSRNFFGPPRSAAYSLNKMLAADDQRDFDRLMVYIPTRIVAADVDGDGKKEVIVGRNNRVYGKWLSNSREYDGGSIACLEWRDNTLVELWQTSKINGYVADYGFMAEGGQLDGEHLQKASLYVTQVPVRMMFGFLLKDESKLLRYDLDFSNE